MFQSFNLIPDLNLFDNVDVPLRYRGFNARRSQAAHRRARSSASASRRACSTIRPSCRAASSSASRSRARLAGDPKLLLADEPTGNLDSQMARERDASCSRSSTAQGTTIVHRHARSGARRARAAQRAHRRRPVATDLDRGPALRSQPTPTPAKARTPMLGYYLDLGLRSLRRNLAAHRADDRRDRASASARA